MIIVLIELVAICSIWNLGIEIVLSDGMALNKLRLWAESKNSKWLEPLIICIWCRPSIHSLVGFVAAHGLGVISFLAWSNFILYPFVVAGTSLVSGVIWSCYKHIEIKSKYYQHLEQDAYFSLKDRKKNYTQNKKS